MWGLLMSFLRILQIYLGATLTFYTLSYLQLSPMASFYARLLASYGTLIFCAIYGVFASLFLRLLGKHRTSQWATARAFHYIIALTTGVRFEIVEGKEYLRTRPCVLIGNHQSELDVLLLGAVFPPYCAVTAKSSLKLVPFLGQFMALSGTVFIDRSNRNSAVAAFEGAAEEMKRERQSVFIFPEGTRSHASGPVMGSFKKGAFHLAVQAGVDVVPVVCANYFGVLGVREKRFRAGVIPVKGESLLGVGVDRGVAIRIGRARLTCMAGSAQTDTYRPS
jgi:lysophosphatidate acyltransferase